MQVHMPASASPTFFLLNRGNKNLKELTKDAIKRSMRLGVQTVSREDWRMSFDSVSRKNAAEGGSKRALFSLSFRSFSFSISTFQG